MKALMRKTMIAVAAVGALALGGCAHMCHGRTAASGGKMGAQSSSSSHFMHHSYNTDYQGKAQRKA